MNGGTKEMELCLKKLPVAYAVFRLELDKLGSPKDIRVEYANQKYGDIVGKKASELVNTSLFDTMDRTASDWFDICYATAMDGEEHQFIRYCIEVDRWLEISTAQLSRGYCAYTFVDVTDEKEKQFNIEKSWSMDDFILECAQLLHTDSEDACAMDEVLKEIGIRLHADRVYILETDQVIVNNTYEWCNEGITAEIDNLQNIPYSVMGNWERTLDTNALVFYPDVASLKESSPEEYEILAAQGIDRLLAVPLYDEAKLMGFLGVDNYVEDILFDTKKVLQSVAFFISAYLRRDKLLDQLEEMSLHDGLTNALNRSAFMQLLRDHSDTFHKVGVMYLDINGLKRINDTKGHQEGDLVICSMYVLLLGVFRETDVYRVGGDEYVVITEHIEEHDFKSKIQELQNKLNENQTLEFAYGYHWEEETDNIREVLRVADESMYINKKRFYENAVIKSNRYRTLLDDRFGITDSKSFNAMIKNGNIVFFLQPKLSKDGKTVVGAEALVRYIKDNGEILAAGEFIPLLESSHLIAVLDYFVYRSVCIQIRKWINAGIKPVRVAVNFSRYTICQYDFLSEIERIREGREVPKEYLEIEVTESIVADNKQMMNHTIQALRASGYAVSLDDFGVEEANLSAISEADFDYIKIDKSISLAVLQSYKSHVLVEGFVKMCHTLGIRVVAEGIEYEEQMHRLIELGVDELQGYYFSRPIPCKEFTEKYLVTKQEPCS